MTAGKLNDLLVLQCPGRWFKSIRLCNVFASVASVQLMPTTISCGQPAGRTTNPTGYFIQVKTDAQTTYTVGICSTGERRQAAEATCLSAHFPPPVLPAQYVMIQKRTSEYFDGQSELTDKFDCPEVKSRSRF